MGSPKPQEEDIVHIREFDIQRMEKSCTWIFVGPPGSGKSTAIENFCYWNKHKYPVARVFCGTSTGYKTYCKIFGELFVSPEYDDIEEKMHITRQRVVIRDQNCQCPDRKICVHSRGAYAINIIDDAAEDRKLFNSKVVKSLFKMGSQHYWQLLLVGVQYAIDVSSDIRSSVSYVALFREPNQKNRKTLYENFGGPAGSYDDFCSLLDQLTGDYTCLIIKQRSQSNRLEDNIFYYRTKPLGEWKFGAQEFRDWNRKRFDPKYQEPLFGI